MIQMQKSNYVWFCRYLLSTKAIQGLISYVPTANEGGSLSVVKSGGKKKESDGKERIDESSLLLMPVHSSTILQMPHYGTLETLVSFFVLKYWCREKEMFVGKLTERNAKGKEKEKSSWPLSIKLHREKEKRHFSM